jgi:hypothetical protein
VRGLVDWPQRCNCIQSRPKRAAREAVSTTEAVVTRRGDVATAQAPLQDKRWVSEQRWVSELCAERSPAILLVGVGRPSVSSLEWFDAAARQKTRRLRYLTVAHLSVLVGYLLLRSIQRLGQRIALACGRTGELFGFGHRCGQKIQPRCPRQFLSRVFDQVLTRLVAPAIR